MYRSRDIQEFLAGVKRKLYLSDEEEDLTCYEHVHPRVPRLTEICTGQVLKQIIIDRTKVDYSYYRFLDRETILQVKGATYEKRTGNKVEMDKWTYYPRYGVPRRLLIKYRLFNVIPDEKQYRKFGYNAKDFFFHELYENMVDSIGPMNTVIKINDIFAHRYNDKCVRKDCKGFGLFFNEWHTLEAETINMDYDRRSMCFLSNMDYDMMFERTCRFVQRKYIH